MVMQKQLNSPRTAAVPLERLPQTGLSRTSAAVQPRESTGIVTGSPLPVARHAQIASHADLQGLDAALDARTMTFYLRPRLPLLAQVRNMKVSRSHLLDCKPGKRALVRYELSTPDKRTKVVVFGKIYSQLDQLMRVDQVTDALWYEVFSGDRTCSTPQPLGVIPELSMHLYLPAEGEFLDVTLAGKRATHGMQWTAQWLGALHSRSLQLSKRFDLTNELKNVAEWAELISHNYPEMAVVVHKMLCYLQRQAELVQFATSVPIHKDFHYRHVLVGRGLKVIDFDEVRLGDPNFDLAHFCANLHLLVYRQRGSARYLRELEREFLFVYAQHIGQPWATFVRAHRHQFRYFYVYTCIKIARQLCLGFGPSPVPTGAECRRQVQLILKHGEKQI